MKTLLNRFISWFRDLFIRVPVYSDGTTTAAKPEVYTVPASPAYVEPDRIKPTKAYADQRQKMPHNRRRKPSKTMRNLYQLS